MSRRIVTYILFCTVAVYGAGLPQLVHHVIDHQGGWFFGSHASAHAVCCSHSCDLPASSEADDCDSEQPESHDCMVCEMLATSHATVAPQVLPHLLHGPAPDLSVREIASAHVVRTIGLRHPRGPPVTIS